MLKPLRAAHLYFFVSRQHMRVACTRSGALKNVVLYILKIASMCGIFFGITRENFYDSILCQWFNLLQHRGPDASLTHSECVNGRFVHLAFHRLAINGISDGMQPLALDNKIRLICNGEIYNWKQLYDKYKFPRHTGSDCEIILHLYNHFQNDIPEMLRHLDGEFAFVIYNSETQEIIAARDPIGVRPLFYGTDTGGDIYFLSELKALPARVNCRQFPPQHYIHTSISEITSKAPEFRKYHYYTDSLTCIVPKYSLYDALTAAVSKRVYNIENSEMLGCLLSGGLDSTIITAIANLYHPGLKTYSFGFSETDCPDLIAAREIARILGTDHTEVCVPISDGIAVINQVIYTLETFDTTTIRASIPQYLLAQYIAQNTNTRVLLTGEGSDEIFNGYLYSKNAPNVEELRADSRRLISELHYFDVLRSDRTTAAHGLELRPPFLDLTHLKYADNDDYFQDYKDQMTKYQLRQAFEEFILEEEINSELLKFVWREKAAFSDAVGTNWITELQKYAESVISNEIFDARAEMFPYLTPRTKEEFLYRYTFESIAGNIAENVLPHFWMPKWQPDSLKDPSARYLK